MYASIHRVTGITVDYPELLENTGSYVRHMTIQSEDEVIEICVFSDKPDALRIDGYADIYADNARMEEEFEQAAERG